MTDERKPEGPEPGNVAPDGGYVVGRGKPPESGKFRKGDGRPRGRRAKGTKNFDTDFAEVMAAPVTLTVNGKPRRVTRQRSIVMRAADNASRGQNPAIKMVFEYGARLQSKGSLPGAADSEFGGSENSSLPCIHELTSEELEQFTMLLHKASGLPYEKPAGGPLAYINDPSDPRNYYIETTPDGLTYRRSQIAKIPDELIDMDSRAYASALFPRKPGCFGS